MKRMRAPKPKGGRKVAYKLIEQDTDQGRAMYRRLAEVRSDPAFEHTKDARVALAWCTSWKPDVDGLLVLGKCRKSSDLDREFHRFDFTILLNQAWWFDLATTDAFREAVLDHECEHMAPVLNERTGEPVFDERGRRVWRIKKHDIEEHQGTIQRRGIYRRNLELAYKALRSAALSGFTSCGACNPHGFIEVDGGGVKRCDCWEAWQLRVNGPREAVAS